jgi:hypothetical protein
MNTPLLVLYDAHGGITDTGERGPLWSSDCRPASTLKGLCAELLTAGWPLHTMLKLPNADEPQRFSDVYKQQFEGKLPKNFDKFAREAKVRDHMANAADPYNLGIPASTYARSDYGTTKKFGDE